ncbi:DNA phosphorothioation system sulfurtransferase DndC [Cyclobacterium xiamenense]|uniref:DNA phosphorothioation system sulfurtransferase DndC n=1 Tax=Cyclobacterium xiamenense TaxID=1297121 RepID=UPI0035D00C9A
MSRKIDYIIDEIIDQYLYADDTNRPWIIGFSGGKDSTVLLQLVWKAIEKIKEFSGIVRRDIYVVCNDTMVENPIITNYVNKVLSKIEEAARDQDMPIYVKKTTPRLEDSFWVNLIGRGYPAPNNSFRWCTERLKVKPTSRFILEQLDITGEAIILIGTRSDESVSRARSIKKHAVRGKRLTKHPNHQNTFVYAPIKHMMLEEVWYVIKAMPSPWGSDNDELFQIYADASADDYECPTMVTNKNHSSCGQSRFGCWVCTVVKEDKSMSALIDNGMTWLAPLLKYRNAIVEERNMVKNRMDERRNGQKVEKGKGTYEPEYRASLLKRLLETQLEIQQTFPELELITNQELVAIQVIWYRDFIFDQKVSTIYNAVYRKELDMKNHDENFRKEEELLKKVCQKDKRFELIQDHLSLLKNKALLTRKRGLKEDLERRIEEYIKKE